MKSIKITPERALSIIMQPLITEKATLISEKNNQYLFKVRKDADKAEIKAAIEYIWKSENINVTDVNTVNVKGKSKRFGRFLGKRSDYKKAYVCVKQGQNLNFTDIKLSEK